MKFVYLGILFFSASLNVHAQESGDGVVPYETASKLLNMIQDYTLTQPSVKTPVSTSEILSLPTGTISGTCEKRSFVAFTATFVYSMNGKTVRASQPGYALADSNGSGTWSMPGYDFKMPAGGKDLGLALTIDSYTIIPKGVVLMRRTMWNRALGYKIKVPIKLMTVPIKIKDPVKPFPVSGKKLTTVNK